MQFKLLLAVLVIGVATPAVAGNRFSRRSDKGHQVEARHYARAQYYRWHGSYYDPAWGQPYALVVPPTVHRQYNWGWSVGTTRLHEIDHQFGRSYPGPYGGGAGFYPTPAWPSDTTQFGVYYVRGPWK